MAYTVALVLTCFGDYLFLSDLFKQLRTENNGSFGVFALTQPASTMRNGDKLASTAHNGDAQCHLSAADCGDLLARHNQSRRSTTT